jgi:hypothetical protein
MEIETPLKKNFSLKFTSSRIQKITIVLIVFFAIDFGFRTYEARELVTNIESSEAVMEDFNSSLRQISDASYSRESKIKNVAIVAKSSSSKIFVTGVQVERMTILPWHKK